MKIYTIYHATGEHKFSEVQNQPRVLAGKVSAESINGACALSQNGYEPWNKENPCRSTGVGDVIVSGDEVVLVARLGFTKLDIIEFENKK